MRTAHNSVNKGKKNGPCAVMVIPNMTGRIASPKVPPTIKVVVVSAFLLHHHGCVKYKIQV
jgi:hypothetical protein